MLGAAHVCATQWLRTVAVNDYVTFKISKSGGRCLCVRVDNVERFPTFKALLAAKGVENVLPGVAYDAAQGAAVYYTLANRTGRSYVSSRRITGSSRSPYRLCRVLIERSAVADVRGVTISARPPPPPIHARRRGVVRSHTDGHHVVSYRVTCTR